MNLLKEGVKHWDILADSVVVQLVKDARAPVIEEIAQTDEGRILIHIQQQHRHNEWHALYVSNAAVAREGAENSLQSYLHRSAIVKEWEMRESARKVVRYDISCSALFASFRTQTTLAVDVSCYLMASLQVELNCISYFGVVSYEFLPHKTAERRGYPIKEEWDEELIATQEHIKTVPH